MGDSPRVCMICANFRPAVGGAEKQAEALARALLAEGGEAFVLTQRVEGLPLREVMDGLAVCREIYAPARRWRYGIGYLASTARFLLRERRRYEIIHCHGMYIHTAAAVLAAKALNKRVVVKIACGGAFGDIAGMRRLKGARVLLAISTRADRFVAVSRETGDELRAIGVREALIAAIPNFVDTGAFRPARAAEKAALRRALGLPPSGAIVASVGRLSPQKELACLLDAWARLGDDRGAALVVVGDGASRAELECMAGELGIAARVRFLGPRRDVAGILRACDSFVLHSLSEGMPNALLEAMACGLPCAAANVGGVKDLVRDGENGLLVEPSNPEALAEALKAILDDGERAGRMGAAARETVERQCAANRIVIRYLELYRGLR
ncbi:MAG: glycosyltransferase [Chlamydiota bacterium]